MAEQPIPARGDLSRRKTRRPCPIGALLLVYCPRFGHRQVGRIRRRGGASTSNVVALHAAFAPRVTSQPPIVCIIEAGDASIDDKAIPHVVDPNARFYRAPELVADGHGDGRADVFAFGAGMFEAATLVLPEPIQKFPGMPAAFHQLLASMLTRAPKERPSAAGVHLEAARLAEVFADAEGPIEEVEVELVDISRNFRVGVRRDGDVVRCRGNGKLCCRLGEERSRDRPGF